MDAPAPKSEDQSVSSSSNDEGEEDTKEQIVETPQLSEDIIEDVEENASEAGLSIDENS